MLWLYLEFEVEGSSESMVRQELYARMVGPTKAKCKAIRI
jgi:hypothetical protein